MYGWVWHDMNELDTFPTTFSRAEEAKEKEKEKENMMSWMRQMSEKYHTRSMTCLPEACRVVSCCVLC